jgi:hypothetical protein
MKKHILSLSFAILLFSFFAPAVSAAPSLREAFDKPLTEAANKMGYSDGAEPEALIGRVIKIALSFLGVVFFILMLFGGFLWMTAAGSEEQVGRAKKLIIAAVTGILIVLTSYAISYFIIDELGKELLIDTPAEGTEEIFIP